MPTSRARCVPREHAKVAVVVSLESRTLRARFRSLRPDASKSDSSMKLRRAAALLLAISPSLAAAQLRPPSAQRPPGPQVQAPPEPGSELKVTLLTMGVGEQVWEQFGHNALWFHVE